MNSKNGWGWRHGFTIVELLIVIVVIAVLAAISVVAYTGIQARAENTKTVHAVASLARSMSALVVDTGVYPGPAGGAWICLPNASSYCGSSHNDPSCFGLNKTPLSDTVKTYLNPVATNVPEVSTQEIDCGSGRTVTGGFYRLEPGNKSASLFYFLRGDVPCEGIGGLKVYKALSENATRCWAILPSLP